VTKRSSDKKNKTKETVVWPNALDLLDVATRRVFTEGPLRDRHRAHSTGLDQDMRQLHRLVSDSTDEPGKLSG
jgi:hypothetical protein